MNHDQVREQTVLEHAMLKHICGALRLALGWKVEAGDASRPLNSLRFVTQSLQRHLDRMMALEEFEGYMDDVCDLAPQLVPRVDVLRQEHQEFRQALPRLVASLEQVEAEDLPEFRRVAAELRGFLDRLERHAELEIGLVQEAYLRDEGGMG